MKMTKVLTAIAAAAVATSVLTVAASAAEAHLCYQTGTYCYRDAYDHSTNGYGSAKWDKFTVNCDSDDPEEKPELEDYFDYDLGDYLIPATYTSANITGDGEYTIKAEHDFWGVNSDSSFNLIHISTDIPYDENIKVTSATVIIDGAEVKTIENPALEANKEYCLFNVANAWNTDIGAFTDAYPTSTIEVKFTIEGLGGAAADTTVEDTTADAPATGDVEASTDSSKGSPDTGIEDVAVIGGLAVLAGAAIAFTRKRK